MNWWRENFQNLGKCLNVKFKVNKECASSHGLAKKVSRNETQKCQSIARKSFEVNSKWEDALQHIIKIYVYQKITEADMVPLSLVEHWWWCI